MKNLIIIGLLLLSVAVHGQNIVKFEYWIDTDPGIGNATDYTNITPAPDIDTLLSLSNGLSEGPHLLGIRSMDANGVWSHTNTFLINVIDTVARPKIVGIEYFWDTDPGIGKADYKPLDVPVYELDTNLWPLFTPPSLSQGYHDLYVRSKDSYGQWSHTNFFGQVEVLPTADDTIFVDSAVCGSFKTQEGVVYTRSGIYYGEQLVAGPKYQIIQYDLEIGATTYSTINPQECYSYTSPSGQHTWNASGTYQDIIPNAAGCDSVITINLSINHSASTISPVVCKSYVSPSGKYTWTSNGTYKDTVMNAKGCDSVITVNLTINRSTGSISPTACVEYTSPSGNTTWTATGTYMDTLQTMGGCDSVVTVNLTINTVDTGVSPSVSTLTANATGASYQWLDCDDSKRPISGETGKFFTTSDTGLYAVAVTQNGCTDTSDCYKLPNGTGIADHNQLRGVRIYPNPTTGIINIELVENLDPSEDYLLQLTDIAGRIVLKQEFTGTTPRVDASNLNAGTYLLRLLCREGVFITRVVMQD